ncbi:hypothetical protein CSC33_5024 [Pseudomonas aeruginosa]|nr:hypothetical protein CSC33_5024 [Pseudomonas aeruginosa]
MGTHARGWGEGPSGVLRLSVFFLSQAGFLRLLHCRFC